MNRYQQIPAAVLVIAALMTITACSKTKKKVSASGGASGQSVLTFRGASR